MSGNVRESLVPPPNKPTRAKEATADLAFEQKPWLASDTLWNNTEAAEYYHVGLGSILLKYFSGFAVSGRGNQQPHHRFRHHIAFPAARNKGRL
jgi:hypothetical protein